MPKPPKPPKRPGAEPIAAFVPIEPAPPRRDPMEVGGPDDEVAAPAPPRRRTGVPEFAVAWVQALEPFTIPGTKVTAVPRIDPMEEEWRGWRIVVAGPSVLLIAPKGWIKGIIGGTGGLAEVFAPYAEAHGWQDADDVRQVFEVPRSKMLIRYYVDDRGDELDDTAFAAAVRSTALAAPSPPVRHAAERLAAAVEAERERAAKAQAKLQQQRIRAAAQPKPVLVHPKKPATPVDDDDVGFGDEGPEIEDDEG